MCCPYCSLFIFEQPNKIVSFLPPFPLEAKYKTPQTQERIIGVNEYILFEPSNLYDILAFATVLLTDICMLRPASLCCIIICHVFCSSSFWQHCCSSPVQ